MMRFLQQMQWREKGASMVIVVAIVIVMNEVHTQRLPVSQFFITILLLCPQNSFSLCQTSPLSPHSTAASSRFGFITTMVVMDRNRGGDSLTLPEMKWRGKKNKATDNHNHRQVEVKLEWGSIDRQEREVPIDVGMLHDLKRSWEKSEKRKWGSWRCGVK